MNFREQLSANYVLSLNTKQLNSIMEILGEMLNVSGQMHSLMFYFQHTFIYLLIISQRPFLAQFGKTSRGNFIL